MSVDQVLSLEVVPLALPELTILRTRSIGGEAAAAVNAGSIVAFAAGISAEDQQDILYSMQLAQRAASAKANRYTAVADWYRAYVDVLGLTGWVIQGFAPTAQEVREGEVEMAKAALKIVAAAAAGPAGAVLTAAIGALEGMAKDDGFITLFEHFGTDGLVGNFQLSAVERGAAGELSATVGAFQLEMSERQEKFLFFKWQSKNVKLWADVNKATFNSAHYNEVRDGVKTRLGIHAKNAIAALPLAL